MRLQPFLNLGVSRDGSTAMYVVHIGYQSPRPRSDVHSLFESQPCKRSFPPCCAVRLQRLRGHEYSRGRRNTHARASVGCGLSPPS